MHSNCLNTIFSVPELEGSDGEQQPTGRAVSTPVSNSVSKEEFDILSGRVNDLFDKLFEEQERFAGTKEDVVQFQRKLEHIEATLIPDLKVRIKTVKKSIPADVSLPRTNKEALEQTRAGLERARAKIAVLEQAKPDQKFKLSESSIGNLFGRSLLLRENAYWRKTFY